MKLEQAKKTVKRLSYFYEARQHGKDLIVSNASTWDYDEMREVAGALGTEKIDVEGTGCGSCGFGAEIRVYGVLEEV